MGQCKDVAQCKKGSLRRLARRATEGVSNGGQENAGKEGEVVPLTPPAPSGGHGGRPMCAVAEALPRLVEGELGKYKDVVVHWPLFGPSVEAAGCSVVRAGLKLMARNYGGAPSALRKAQSKPMAKAAKGLARTIRNGVRGDQGLHAGEVDGRGLPRVTENEAKVLNSLKVLLQWVGEWERVLVEWCGGRPEGVAEEGGQVRPVLGQQLGQVKKELRSEYSAAVKNAVERLSSAIFRQRELSIR